MLENYEKLFLHVCVVRRTVHCKKEEVTKGFRDQDSGVLIHETSDRSLMHKEAIDWITTINKYFKIDQNVKRSKKCHNKVLRWMKKVVVIDI